MEISKRLDTDIVVRRRLINGVWKITLADTQSTWWDYVKNKYYGNS